MKRAKRENTTTLDRFNRGRPLRVFDNDDQICIIDYNTGKVWEGYNIGSTYFPKWRDYEEIKLKKIPSEYVKESVKSAGIGGVGVTLRFIGLYKAHINIKRKANYTVVYATNIKDKDDFETKMKVVDEHITIGDFDDQEDEYGLAVDIISSLEYLEVVCANIVNTGAKVLLDDLSVNSFECIGAERLDRRTDDPHRASGNWRYSFIPNHWEIPLVWEDLARNVIHEDIEKVPQPLQQHVVRMKLNQMKATGKYDILEKQKLQTLIPRKRWVSGALSIDQTRQLLQAFYILYVEQTTDTKQRNIAKFIMFRYLVERGFTSRWMGKYNQDALYLGNGNKIRKFKRLDQYEPHRLKVEILNSIYKPGGELRGRGSKGTRSKYATENRYVPKRRMKKPVNWRLKMMEPPAVDAVPDESEMNEKDEGFVEDDDDSCEEQEEDVDSDEWEDAVPVKKQKLSS